MPAQTKYLSDKTNRFLKISAGVVGGYFLSICFHLIIGLIITNKSILVMTSAYSAFLLWVAFLVFAFLIRKGKHVWLIYSISILILSFIIYLLK
ncbi:hypothetical protein [Aureivirga sp. CE67]|uniref:hypothetical protein n=1 Tax=Aureivirga sp. CE67 TaxID=1788983 RepID=UPI0018CB2098|nr:hypothetical protein [Aureivirga sp. CE67]